MSSFHCVLQFAIDSGDQVESKILGVYIGHNQLVELERAYNINPHPTTAEKKKLAKTLHCNERIVRAWFERQNKKKRQKSHKKECGKYCD